MAYPLTRTIYSHAAAASSPLQRGWGYVSILPLDFIPPTPFKRGGLAHPWHNHWQAPFTPTSPPRAPLFRGAGGMSLYPLFPLPLFHTPDPFQKGRADAFILFPIGSHYILPRCHRELPSSEGLGVCPYILTFFFIPPAPFKRGGLTHPWHTHWQAPYTSTPQPRAPLFRGAGGMSTKVNGNKSFPAL